jgi:hypothetical protein
MINPKVYKGIQYIILDDLPEEQRINIIETLSQDFFIKILVNGKVLNNCIQFKDYLFWFENIFLVPVNGSVIPNSKHST